MKNWQKKRLSDRKAQEAYWKEHRYCEVCLVEGRGRVETADIHEILYKSQGGKCEPDNEIAVCRPDHQRAHFLKKPYLHRDDLYKMKKERSEQMKWLGEHKIVEDNMAIIKGEDSHKRYHKICPECGAYYYLRDCSCGWKFDRLRNNDTMEAG